MIANIDLQWAVPVLFWFTAGVLVWASLHDIAARILPDWCAAVIGVVGVLLRLREGDLLISLGCAVAVFAVTAFCWRRGWLGGGDVKLLVGCSVLVPPYQVIDLVLTTSLAGGGLALIYVALRLVAGRKPLRQSGRRPKSRVARVIRIERWRIMRRGPLPYGCAIAVAALYVLFGPLTTWR